MDYGNSKKNIVLVVLVVVLGLFVVGLGGYLVYDKLIDNGSQVEDNKPSHDDTKPDDDKENNVDKDNDRDTALDVDIHSREVTDVMELLFGKSEEGIYSAVEMQFGSGLYTKELSVSDLTDGMIANIVYHYALRNGFVDKNDIDQINAEGNGGYVGGVIPVSYFKKSLQTIFGDEITYHNFNEHVADNSTGEYCPNARYHSESDTYRIYEGCGGFCIPETYTKLVSATKDGEKMEVVVQAMWKNCMTSGYGYSNFDREHPFYEDANNTMEVSQVFDNYRSSISKYRYTFKRDNNGDYHFYEVKKMNS